VGAPQSKDLLPWGDVSQWLADAMVGTTSHRTLILANRVVNRSVEWPSRVAWVPVTVAYHSVWPWACRMAFCLSVLSVLAGQAVDAQTINPRVFGFDIPHGHLRHPETPKNVLTVDQNGQPVVGELYVGVGDYWIIRLPSDHFEARPPAKIQRTERPFQRLDEQALEQLYREKFPEFKIRREGQYLFVYNASELFADAASQILGKMYPGVVKFMNDHRVATRKSETPLVVIMFASDHDFQRFPPNMVAYYDPRTNYVVLREPQVAPEDPSGQVVLSQAFATIAHEGAHQILANIGVHQRLAGWPPWLAEGLAEFLAPTTWDTRSGWAAHGKPNQWRLFEIEQYLLRRGPNPVLGEWLETTVSSSRLTSTGYAAAWGLTDYLVKKQRVAFDKYLRKCTEIRPLEGFAPDSAPGTFAKNSAEFRKAFGEDLADLENKVLRYLEKIPFDPPFRDHPHYVAGVAIPNSRKANRWASVFLTAESARNWREETLKTLPEDQRNVAQCFFIEVTNRQAAIFQRQQFLEKP
jgi:hypothetical protein